MFLFQQPMQGLRSAPSGQYRGKYGKNKSRDLLYCRTCGKRFASTQASELFGLHLPAETIRQIITFSLNVLIIFISIVTKFS
jgi:hypothetical protein